MDLLSVMGLLVILGTAAGLVMVYQKQKSAAPAGEQRGFRNDFSTDAREQLKSASSGQTVTLIGEPERAVQASVTLNEMFQQTPRSSWSRTGAVSKALILAGDIWILKVPSQEAGKPIWLRAKELPSMSLMRFYKGTDDNPGPARIFKNNDQSDPVPYDLPKNLTPGVAWEIIDIGAFDAEVDGLCENAETGDRFYFVTSREQGGNRRLIYLDARKGEAKGSGGLFLAEQFEPSVDVSAML